MANRRMSRRDHAFEDFGSEFLKDYSVLRAFRKDLSAWEKVFGPNFVEAWEANREDNKMDNAFKKAASLIGDYYKTAYVDDVGSVGGALGNDFKKLGSKIRGILPFSEEDTNMKFKNRLNLLARLFEDEDEEEKKANNGDYEDDEDEEEMEYRGFQKYVDSRIRAILAEDEFKPKKKPEEKEDMEEDEDEEKKKPPSQDMSEAKMRAFESKLAKAILLAGINKAKSQKPNSGRSDDRPTRTFEESIDQAIEDGGLSPADAYRKVSKQNKDRHLSHVDRVSVGG